MCVAYASTMRLIELKQYKNRRPFHRNGRGDFVGSSITSLERMHYKSSGQN